MSQIDNRRENQLTDPRHIGNCLKCGCREPKRQMWTILTRFGSYGHNRTVGQVCDKCMKEKPATAENNIKEEIKHDLRRKGSDDGDGECRPNDPRTAYKRFM